MAEPQGQSSIRGSLALSREYLRNLGVVLEQIEDNNRRLCEINTKLIKALLEQQKIVDAQDAIIMAYKLQGRTPEKAIDAMRHHAETEKMVRAAIAETERGER